MSIVGILQHSVVPIFKKDIRKIDKIQRRATKLELSIKNVNLTMYMGHYKDVCFDDQKQIAMLMK